MPMKNNVRVQPKLLFIYSKLGVGLKFNAPHPPDTI